MTITIQIPDGNNQKEKERIANLQWDKNNFLRCIWTHEIDSEVFEEIKEFLDQKMPDGSRY